MRTRVRAFVSKYRRIQKRLISEAAVINEGEEMHVHKAQWDTGASCTSISNEVIDRLGLIPIGNTLICTPSGERVLNTYIVNIRLWKDVIINDVVVIGSEIGAQGIDVLIGMDIISMGDFAVSNYNGKTQFSFRIPSVEAIDLTRPIEKQGTN